MFSEGSKVAVVLVGFGSPSDISNVRPFLYEIFSDTVASPFNMPDFLVPPIAKIVSYIASRSVERRYAMVSSKESSTRVISRLAGRLEADLRQRGIGSYRVFSAGRYGSPSISDALHKVVGEGIGNVIVIPLFPQYAVSTVGSIRDEIARLIRTSSDLRLDVRIVDPWYESSEFITAWADSVRNALKLVPAEVRDRIHILFSAHSIPMLHIEHEEDSYPLEIVGTAHAIFGMLGGNHSMSIAYQSAPPIGRWVGPPLEETLRKLGKKGVRNCMIVPISFLFDNVETWCDIDSELLPKRAEFGFEHLVRATPPIESPRMLSTFANLLR